MFHKTYEAFHKKHFREFMGEDCTAIEGSGKEGGLKNSAILECLERMYVVAYITVLKIAWNRHAHRDDYVALCDLMMYTESTCTAYLAMIGSPFYKSIKRVKHLVVLML